MNAEIISIGTELLLGHILNTNAAYLSHKLAELGIDLYYQTSVGDNTKRLEECIRRSAGRSDIVIMTGGLGPTVDDITVEALSRIGGEKTVLNRTVLKDLRSYFALKKLKIPPGSMRQAYIPRGARWVRNKVGTAPGLMIGCRDALLIALPGPPRELIPMFEGSVIPFLKKKFGVKSIILTRTVKTTGLAESQVNHKVRDLLMLGPKVTVGIYARLGEVDLKITAKEKDAVSARRAISRVERIVRRRLGGFVFGCDEDTLEGADAKILTGKRVMIAVAESCTGGLVSHRLTNVSGSSRFFLMGAISYSNSAKANILGVREESLKAHGAVSGQVAREMASGVRRLASADIGVGITGIAGPTGGTRKKPVGLVYVAFASDRTKIVREFRFKGSREEIKYQTSQVALNLIRRNA